MHVIKSHQTLSEWLSGHVEVWGYSWAYMRLGRQQDISIHTYEVNLWDGVGFPFVACKISNI